MRASKGPRVGATVCLAVMVVVSGNGCSLLFADGPPPNHREARYFDCESTDVLPAVDTMLATSGVFYVLAAALTPPIGGVAGPGMDPAMPTPLAPSRRGLDGTILLASLPLVVLPVTSAVYGYMKAKRCGNAKAELAARLNGPPAARRPPEP